MGRNSRHKSHRQHYRRSSVESSESDDEGSARYGPEILLPEGKSKGNRVDSLKEKHGNQAGDKRKSSASKEQHGVVDSLLHIKKKRASVSVSSERWEAKENALSLLAYLDPSKEKDSKADSDSSGGDVGAPECSEKGFDKSRRTGSNGVDEIRVSRNKEVLEHRVNDSSRGKSRAKSDGDEIKMEVKEAKKALDFRREGSVSFVPETLKCAEDAGKQGCQSANGPQEAPQKKVQRNTEWKIQDELRNPELEKELENRILRRREESGDRDRWRDDDRDREGKSYRSRDTHHKDERHHDGKQKDDKLKGSRCKDERKSEDKPRANKYKEERHMDDKPRADRYKDDKPREERERHKDVKQKDDKHREEKYRDDKIKADKNKEVKLEDSYREEKYKEDRYREEKYRDDRYKDDKSKDEKYRPEQSHRDCTVEHHDSKHFKDESKQRVRGKENKHYESDQEYSSYFDDRYPEPDTSHNRHSQKLEGSKMRRSRESKDSFSEDERGGTSRVCEDDLLVQDRLASDLRCSSVMDVATNKDQQKRACEIVSKIDKEKKRVKSVEVGSEWKDTSFEERPQLGRDNQHAQKFDHDHDRPKEQAILRAGNRTERYLDGHREESPVQSSDSSLKSNACLSPVKMTRRSPTPSTNDMSHRLSYGKNNKRKRLESGHGFSSATSMRGETRTAKSVDRVGDSDRCRPHSDHQDKTRDRESVIVMKDNGDRRGRSRSTDRVCSSRSRDRVCRSQSTDRVCSSHLNDAKSDRFSRAPSVHAMDSTVTGLQDDASGVDHYPKRAFTSGHSSVSGEGPKTSYHSDKMPSLKPGWSHFASNSRSVGPPLQQRTPFHVRPSGHLPPPPPFRPGIDNPSVLGPNSGAFEEGHCSRDQGRADWNNSASFNRVEFNGLVRNWNSQAQGPGSGNFYIPFHHQSGGHPPGAFHNIGQQHAGPPMFRGLRPPMDMAHAGIPYHMWDNGDGNPAHNGAFGWQRQADDGRGHVQGSHHGWDGYTEESMMYGRREWYAFGQGMGNRCWDRPTGMGKGQKTDMNMDFSDRNESNYQGPYTAEEIRGGLQDPRDRQEKLKSERSSTESIDIRRCDQVSRNVAPENSSCAFYSETKKYKHECEDTRYYLSKLDVSAELAGPDLYSQYINKLGTGQTMSPDEANFTTDKAYEDHQLEVDTDTEALLSSLDLRRAFFPCLPENHMQMAMEIYKQARQRSRDVATLDTPMNAQIAATKKTDKSSSFGDRKEELWCEPDNGHLTDVAMGLVPKSTSTPHDSLISEIGLPCFQDVAVHNDVKKGQEVPKTASEGINHADQTKSVYDDNAAAFSEQPLNESISEKIKLSEKVINWCSNLVNLTGPENFDCNHKTTVDAHNLRVVAYVGSATAPDSEHVSEKMVEKHREDAESCYETMHSETHSFSCKFCARGDSIGLNGICVRCQGGSQPNADFCGDTPIQQGEVMEHTRITHEEGFKLLNFKELVSAACVVHTLRKVSFHVRLPAILLPHMAEVSICNVS